MKRLFLKFSVFTLLLAFCFSFDNHSFAKSKKNEARQAEYTIILYLNGCDLESEIDKKTNQLNGEASEALAILQRSSFDDSNSIHRHHGRN